MSMNMRDLYDYQQELLEKSHAALAPERARVMMQLPTGGGKTEIAGALLKDFLVDGRKAVWLTHREELANQTEDRLNDNWSIQARHATERWRIGRPAPGWRNRVAIFKAQTVSRRNKDSTTVWDNYGPDDLLVIDEAHHSPASGWERAIKQWPGRVWGLTATPWRLEPEKGFNHLFDTLITGPEISELQADEHLAPSSVWAPTEENRIVGKEIRQGEYTPGGIERGNDQAIMTTMAVTFWLNMAAGRQTIVYAVSKGHADNLVGAFEERGISAKAILSNTSPDDREKAIEDFETGSLMVLVNVAVATEGFDLPEASCVMITRPTKSLALYLQMVGRGLRHKKGDVSDCLILDLAGNAEEQGHGLPETDRRDIWSLAPRGNSPVGDGDPPVRYCHECNYMAHPAHHKCPQCGADFGRTCPICVKFHSWSRWTEEGECPIPHDPVCDACHDEAHYKLGVERHDGEQNWLSYADDAYELREEGDLEAAFRNLCFAIHLAKQAPKLSFIECKLVVSWYIDRACMHFEMGNVKLAEDDYELIGRLFDLDGGYDTDDCFLPLRRFWNLVPASYSRDSRILVEMHQKRAEMYEALGCSEKAEFDRQKAQRLTDNLDQASAAANGENAR